MRKLLVLSITNLWPDIKGLENTTQIIPKMVIYSIKILHLPQTFWCLPLTDLLEQYNISKSQRKDLYLL